MKYRKLSFIIGLTFVLAGCGVSKVPQVKEEVPVVTGQVVVPQLDMTDWKQVSDYTLQALKDFNMENLEKVTSSQGIRFSPYSYVDTGRHITLQKSDLVSAFSGETEYVWGTEDGTGDPMLMTFKRYLKRYVYDVDFQSLAKVSSGTSIKRGNMMNNVNDIYSGSLVVEYYIPSINVEYQGMDWKALTLVFDKEGTDWKLRAVVHHEWTI